MARRFNTSGYTKNYASAPPIGKSKVIGLMKYELRRKIIIQFVALRRKLYTYKQLDAEKLEYKGCKGIKKCVVKKTLTSLQF